MTAPMALRPREAARALGVSERWLWEQTKAGEIPCTKVGRVTLYPREMLEEWLRRRAMQQQPEGGAA
ncbi:MAG: helix-turn-helix domain-containing protein [Planctomycetia bacterium]|jgi:excisionase family DNA binding protein